MSGQRRTDAVTLAARRLDAAGVEDARDEARRLLQAASGLSPARLLTDMSDPMPDAEQQCFERFVERREAREPLSHILGYQPFWTLDLMVTPDVLTPRSDTETLVRLGLDHMGGRTDEVRILDVATGSGAIALALLSELSSAHCVATDISAAALKIARHNAHKTGLADRLSLVQTHWVDGVSGRFDLIVSNPPYIARDVIDSLEPEVRDYEPYLALDGGETGFDPYPGLLNQARLQLAPGGLALVEIGYDQGDGVLAIAYAAGARDAQIHTDLAGRDRVVSAQFL